MRIRCRLFIIFLIFVAAHTASLAEEQTAIVRQVVDGDTVLLEYDDGKLAKVRLANVDCPETGTAAGIETTFFVGELLLGKTVEVRRLRNGAFNRSDVVLVLDGIDINRHLLETGHAKAESRFCSRGEWKELKKIEARAQNPGKDRHGVARNQEKQSDRMRMRPTMGPFWVNMNNGTIHSAYGNCLEQAKNKRKFPTITEALSAGKRLCGNCLSL